MRIFLDTNVLVSALTARGLTAELFRLVASRHTLITGEVNLVELARVLRVQFKASDEQISIAESAMKPFQIVPRPLKLLPIEVRDADDSWVLASAVAGRADMLVTGDQDLLTLENAPLPIVTPRECWERLRK